LIALAPEPAEPNRLDGAEVDAMVEPLVVQGRDLVRFVAGFSACRPGKFASCRYSWAGCDELPPRSTAASGRATGRLSLSGWMARGLSVGRTIDLSLGEHAAIEIDNVYVEFMPDVERQDVVAAGVSATRWSASVPLPSAGSNFFRPPGPR
jgi:hypothetical protein